MTPEQPQAAIDGLQAEIAELRRSRRRLVEAATVDRRELERVLHDGLQQQLVAVAIDLRRLAGLMDGQSVAATALVEEMATNLRDALADATALAQRIHPPFLDGRGFPASVRAVAASAGVTVTVDAPGLGDYPPEISAALHWTCAEALSSASPGSEATVAVRNEDGGVAFEVAIAGLHPSARIERLQDRIEALDGRLIVDTVAEGSRLQGWLPLSR